MASSTLDGINGIRIIMAGTINGSTRIVNYANTPEQFFELVERFKVTYTLSAPFKAVELLDHPQIETANLSSIKYYTCSGAAASFEIIKSINKYLCGGKLCHTYGMTELVGPVAINFNHTKNESVGQLISGCEVKIVNEKGERLGIDEVGEFCIRQPFQFSGYLGDYDNTLSYFDTEGFFATGDIARFDRNGDLFIIDRKKEMFKYCDYQVTPSEIEVFLNRIDGVKHSCVVPIPNEKLGNLPAALIIKSQHSTCNEQSISEAVSSMLTERMSKQFNNILTIFSLSDIPENFAYYKQLRGGVYFIDGLPLTVSGKIARNSAKQIAIDKFNSQQLR